jgi:hypothetical protein
VGGWALVETSCTERWFVIEPGVIVAPCDELPRR